MFIHKGDITATIIVIIVVFFFVIVVTFYMSICRGKVNIPFSEVGGYPCVFIVVFKTILIGKRIPIVKVALDGELVTAERVPVIVHKGTGIPASSTYLFISVNMSFSNKGIYKGTL